MVHLPPPRGDLDDPRSVNPVTYTPFCLLLVRLMVVRLSSMPLGGRRCIVPGPRAGREGPGGVGVTPQKPSSCLTSPITEVASTSRDSYNILPGYERGRVATRALAYEIIEVNLEFNSSPTPFWPFCHAFSLLRVSLRFHIHDAMYAHNSLSVVCIFAGIPTQVYHPIPHRLPPLVRPCPRHSRFSPQPPELRQPHPGGQSELASHSCRPTQPR